MLNEAISMLQSEVDEMKENGLSRKFSKLLLLHGTTLNNMNDKILVYEPEKLPMLGAISCVEGLNEWQYDDTLNARILIKIVEEHIKDLENFISTRY